VIEPELKDYWSNQQRHQEKAFTPGDKLNKIRKNQDINENKANFDCFIREKVQVIECGVVVDDQRIPAAISNEILGHAPRNFSESGIC
jgi:hypothetical protein